MKATWLMAWVSYAATLSIWRICMHWVVHGATLQGMEVANGGTADSLLMTLKIFWGRKDMGEMIQSHNVLSDAVHFFVIPYFTVDFPPQNSLGFRSLENF